MEVMNAKEIFMNIYFILFKNLKWIFDLFY